MRPVIPFAVVIIVLGAAWWLAMDTRSFQVHDDADDSAPALIAAAPKEPETQATPPRGAADRAAPTPRAEPLDQPSAEDPEPEAPKAPVAPEDDMGSVLAPQQDGPVEELEQRFKSESRARDSQDAEIRVKRVWQHHSIPAGLLNDVECRKTICRVVVNWTPDHNMGFVAALTGAVGSFSTPVGIAAAEPPDSDGVRRVVTYFYPAKNVELP